MKTLQNGDKNSGNGNDENDSDSLLNLNFKGTTWKSF